VRIAVDNCRIVVSVAATTPLQGWPFRRGASPATNAVEGEKNNDSGHFSGYRGRETGGTPHSRADDGRKREKERERERGICVNRNAVGEFRDFRSLRDLRIGDYHRTCPRPPPAEGSLLEVSKTHQHTRLRANDPALILREQDEAFFLPAPFSSEYALILTERNTQKTREDTCLPWAEEATWSGNTRCKRDAGEY